jgi:hypothetical protein
MTRPAFAIEMERLRVARPAFKAPDGDGGYTTLAEMGNDGDLRVYGWGPRDKGVTMPLSEMRRFAEWVMREWPE